MYSGTTFRRGSGNIVGVHQKIDRSARRSLNYYINKSVKFPGIRSILSFEGKNGPDGLKLKGSTNDDPWHFINPANPSDDALIQTIDNHIYNLSIAIKSGDLVKASFDAAWLAHAITDGLTPAHHYALDEKIEELWGKSHSERKGMKDKGLIRGNSGIDTLSKNWQYWGAGGIFTAHLTYEMGVASAIATENYKDFYINQSDIDNLKQVGFRSMFLESVRMVYDLNIYDKYVKSGWTVALASETKEVLVPEIIKCVVLAWYEAVLNATGNS